MDDVLAGTGLQPRQVRKRPVVVTALRFTGWDYAEAVAAWCGGRVASEVIPDGRMGKRVQVIVIPTLEGLMRAYPGDWVVRGVKGEFYPVKDEIFRLTYEEA